MMSNLRLKSTDLRLLTLSLEIPVMITRYKVMLVLIPLWILAAPALAPTSVSENRKRHTDGEL